MFTNCRLLLAYTFILFIGLSDSQLVLLMNLNFGVLDTSHWCQNLDDFS